MSNPITIHGGGLTGLSLAIALRKNDVSVTLHEAGSYPRHRVCGEFISGVSSQTLETLGIADAFTDAKQHRSVAWFHGNKHLRDNLLPEPALAISRYRLDDLLKKSAVALGANLLTGSRSQMNPNAPGEVWTAGRKPAKGKWIGLKAHVRGIIPKAQLEMHSGPLGYLGITPIEDNWLNVCGLFRMQRNIGARHENLLAAYLTKNGNTDLACRIHKAEWREGSFTAVAGFALGLQASTPGMLSLGDSYAIIPPFTGNGMSMAFQSSETALPHLLDYAKGKITWSEACTLTTKHLRARFETRLASAKLIHPMLLSAFARPLLKHAPLKPILSLIR